MKLRRSWRERLADDRDLPKVIEIDKKMSKKWGEGTCVIPTPMEVNNIMKKVPKRKLVTVKEIRELLARKHGATIGCPITTGIFAFIAARAAGEDEAEGKKRITPYWRTLKAEGELNPKFPGGVEDVKKRLEAEGHTVIQKGKRFFIQDYEQSLISL